MNGDRLNPDEDQTLRRLHWFETLGCELSTALSTLRAGFRSRDRRATIREPGAAWKGPEDNRDDVAAAQDPDQPRYWIQ